jgi:hypothetical protein
MESGVLKRALMCVLMAWLGIGCVSWSPVSGGEDGAVTQVPSSWRAVEATRAGELWAYEHKAGAKIALREQTPACVVQTCAVWALSWLDVAWPGAQLISREDPIEGEELQRWRFVLGHEGRVRELVMWHAPRRVYVLEADGQKAAMDGVRAELDRVIAEFTLSEADFMVTRRASKGPDTSALAERGLIFATDVVPAEARPGLELVGLDPLRVRIMQRPMLIQGELYVHKLAYETSAQDYLSQLYVALSARHSGKIELVVESPTAGTLFVRESAMSSLVPMIHVWRVQLRGTSAVQVALSTPAELYDENKATLVALLRAFQTR